MKNRIGLISILAVVAASACSGVPATDPIDASPGDTAVADMQRACSPDLVFSYYFVVCGSDGKTYGYWELAWCRGLDWKGGACDPVDCSKGESGPPVCGKDGKTYAGDRTAGCHGVLKEHDGPCELDGGVGD
jgi:hypothetical protein